MDIYDEILGEYEGDTTKSPIATILNDIREAEKRNQVPLERFTKEQYIQLVNARIFSRSSIATRLSKIKQITEKKCSRCGISQTDVLFDFPTPKEAIEYAIEQYVKILFSSFGEFNEALKNRFDLKTHIGLRSYVFWGLLWCGIPHQKVAGIRMEEIDFQHQKIGVHYIRYEIMSAVKKYSEINNFDVGRNEFIEIANREYLFPALKYTGAEHQTTLSIRNASYLLLDKAVGHDGLEMKIQNMSFDTVQKSSLFEQKFDIESSKDSDKEERFLTNLFPQYMVKAKRTHVAHEYLVWKKMYR